MRWRWVSRRRIILLAGVVVVLVVGGALIGSIQDELIVYGPSKLILDRNERYLGELPASDGDLGYWSLSDPIPPRILTCALQTEDRAYFDHGGVHLPSIVRALGQNLRAGRVISGASTIAMQVARMQTPGRRHLWNKLCEALSARALIQRHGHQRVLRHYLTIAPYGNRVHGVVRAARLYFDKPVADLSWLQAAFLAGLPQAPGHLDPFDADKLPRALERARRILLLLHQRGLLSELELAQALASDLSLAPPPQRDEAALHAILRLSQRAQDQSAPVLRATLDLDIQRRVQRLVQDNLAPLRARGASNTSALVVDPRSNGVLAYVGSADYFNQEDRGAIDFITTKRPPGSALKPFIYALALERGLFTTASELSDIRLEFPDALGQVYVPRNISHNFLGPMLLRDALANSRNIPALAVLSRVGVETTLDFFRRAGVADVSSSPGHYGLGLALGNLPVTLEELTGLYTILAQGGRSRPLRYFEHEPVEPGRRVLSAATAQLMLHMLSDPLARLPSFPRGGALEYDYATAVKTGTSQGYRDAWAVATTDRLLVAVWVGNHDWRRMNHLGGLSASARPVKRILDALVPGIEPHRPVPLQFPPPADHLARAVCTLSGHLAGPHCPHHRLEYFRPGSEPVLDCPYHRPVAIDVRNGLRAEGDCPKRFVTERVLVNLPEVYAPWARAQHLELAPRRTSPLCRRPPEDSMPRVRISAPANRSRYLWDPDTPAEYSTLRLAAEVTPPEEDIIWIDNVPVARVAYPHEYCWPLAPGTHHIRAALAQRAVASPPITVRVSN